MNQIRRVHEHRPPHQPVEPEHPSTWRARALTTALGAATVCAAIAAWWWPSWLLLTLAVVLAAATTWRLADPGDTR